MIRDDYKRPIQLCAWCGMPLYDEAEIKTYANDEICEVCEKLAYKGSTAVDYIVHLLKDGEVGSVISFFQDNRLDDWTEAFGAFVRFYFMEDYDKWVKF